MIQKVKSQKWFDESGQSVPVDYISTGVRLKERLIGKSAKKATSLHGKLKDFKQELAEDCDRIYKAMMEEHKVSGDSKGNFTMFNFDRSVKIEVSVSERIEFDDLTIKACKEKLNSFIEENVDSKKEFVKQLVQDAFSTSRGRLDAKKVMSLLKYRAKIKDKLFQDALNLIEESIRRPDSRRYYRIWQRNEDTGDYDVIDLNFSSIDAG